VVPTSEREKNKKKNWISTQIYINSGPMVTGGLEFKKLYKGASLQLEVNVEAYPSPNFQWKRNGEIIPGAQSQIYFVNRVTSEDAGTYTCDVWNTFGKAEWTEALVSIYD